MKERNTAQANQFVSSMAVIVVDPLKIAYLGKACSNKTVWHSYFTLERVCYITLQVNTVKYKILFTWTSPPPCV